jgi:Rrf2 family nitric oxide-sensitive transcriptional repressor
MRLNAFADVSLRAMMVLAAAPDGGLLTTQSIADAVGTPYNHVSKAMARLRELGMIDVERGRNGGSRLNMAGRTATVGQLLRLLNTRVDPADCHTVNGDCPLINECRLRGALAQAREAFYRELDPLVIAELPNHRQMAPVFAMIGLRPGL